MSGTSSTERVVSDSDGKPRPRTVESQPGDEGVSTTGTDSPPAFVVLMRRLEHAWPLSVAVLLLVIIILGAFRTE
jgi:hypothetical protein